MVIDFHWVNDPTETISAWSMTPLKRIQRGHCPRCNSDIVDFLGEYEAICETALGAANQDPMWVDWWKKTEGRKSRDTVMIGYYASIVGVF
jgi:hypothetical protein